MTYPRLQDYHREGEWGRTILYFESASSTNDLALEAGLQDAPQGLVIVAEEQTAGRGRLSRRWTALPGCCLLFSLLFRPRPPFTYHASRIPMLCGLALAAAVPEVAGVLVKLKWPNDLIVERCGEWRKVAGMLSEVDVTPSPASGILVVGVGLNVNVPAGDLAQLAPNATSLSAESGRPIDRVALLDAILLHVERLVARQRTGWDPLQAWQEHLAWMGEPVEVHTPAGVVTGTAEGVDAEGALLLRYPNGDLRQFSVGDVSLRTVEESA